MFQSSNFSSVVKKIRKNRIAIGNYYPISGREYYRKLKITQLYPELAVAGIYSSLTAK